MPLAFETQIMKLRPLIVEMAVLDGQGQGQAGGGGAANEPRVLSAHVEISGKYSNC